jgi:hypothetical protein
LDVFTLSIPSRVGTLLQVASFLLRTVAFQNPYPLHNTPLPLAVVTHTIAHILHCDNSSGFYQGYFDQMELSFMLTLLLRLAQTDSTHIWGHTPPANESRDPSWLLWTAVFRSLNQAGFQVYSFRLTRFLDYEL